MTDRKHPHNGTPITVAAECLGADLSLQEGREIVLKSRMGAAVDDIVDSSPDGNFEHVVMNDLTSYFDPEHFAWFSEWNNRPNPEQVLREMYELNAEKRSALTIGGYVTALMAEAKYFAGVFAVEPHNDSRERLNDWIGHFARGGYCADAAIDMPFDYRSGQILIEPSLRHRYALLQRAAGELSNSLIMLRRPRAVRALARTGLHTLSER